MPVFSMVGVFAYCSAKKGSWIKRLIITCAVMAFVPILNSAFYMFNDSYYVRWFFMPILIMTSIVTAIFGGWVAAITSGTCTSAEFIYGLRMPFDTFYVTYAMIKSEVFAFVLVTIPAYFGYYINGGALDVGKASTNAVVCSSTIIIILNYVLTQTLLG
jgi:phospholipid/cholesterol/gamma-HCH transport system permease protein